jgi:hypothetical protein
MRTSGRVKNVNAVGFGVGVAPFSVGPLQGSTEPQHLVTSLWQDPCWVDEWVCQGSSCYVRRVPGPRSTC